MSGTFDKRTDKINRREERALKEQREKRKTRIIAITVTVVFAILVSGAVFVNSKFIRRTLTAVTIGGVNFSAAEFDYYFFSQYYEYQNWIYQQFGESAASMGMLPIAGIPLSSQPYPYPETEGETWADYFNKSAFSQMSELVQYYNAAVAAGHTLSDEDRAMIDNEFSTYRIYAEMYGFPSLDAFIAQNYGNNLNESSLRKVMEFINLASSYSEQKLESFTYSASELTDYYTENKDELDSFTYRYFLVNSETVLQSDYESDEEYEEARAAALADAIDKAAAIAAGISSEDDFVAAAFEYNPRLYEERDSTLKVYPGSWLGSVYGPWMKENVLANGAVTTADSTNGSYVVYFIERSSNEYPLASMRQLLVLRDKLDPEDFIGEDHDHDSEDHEAHENNPEYLQAVDEADRAARERADILYNLFTAGGATEEALLELMAGNSDDTTEGGFYDKISKDQSQNKMVPEIEEWLFAPGRKNGDFKLIRTESYGYHLVFFMGHGERFCDHIAKTKLSARDYEEWKANLPPVEATKRWAFVLTQN